MPMLGKMYRVITARKLRDRLQLRARMRKLALRVRIWPGGAEAFVRTHLAKHGKCWCFILGVNNSGTTLLLRLMRSHPGIRALPREGQHLTEALPRPRKNGVPRFWSQRLDLFRWDEESSSEQVEQIVFDWLLHYSLEPGVLLEKSPPNTIRSLWLQRHFVPARFVAVVRNPFAVAEGIRRRDGLAIEAAAEHWCRANLILLADLERLEHHCLIKYEELCRDPLGILDKIRDVLELEQPFPSDLLGKRAPSLPTEESINVQDQNASSIARLSPHEIAQIARITEPARQRLGYGVPESPVANS